MKRLLKIVLAVVIIIIIAFAGGIIYLTRGLGEISDIQVDNIDLSNLEDGVYNGTYKNGRWTNQVMVTVESQRIQSIDVVKEVTFERPEITSELINMIIEKQSLDVDGISGATVTSNAYLKSIENALDK